jgi:tyrosyl-tRNA synthetase
MTTISIDQQLEFLRRGVVPGVWADMHAPLREKLARGKPLRVKVGFDPTAPDLHLGHTVVMAKMRQFQELGHHVIFLIGDFTGMIGDPTGKSQTRPPLSREDVLRNAETYKAQVFKILDPQLTEIAFNSTWLGALTAEEMIRLTAKYTVARLLERNDFRARYQSQRPIAVHEFLYPLLQAYDSVALRADVELGGNDQLFNLMVGRDVMREYGLEPQVILTTELLFGTDARLEGETLVGEKMSKSLGNYIGVDDPPAGEHGIFGKLMSVCDPLMWHYFELLSAAPPERYRELRQGHPKEAKKALAAEISARYHGEAASRRAAEEFERVHPSAGAERGVPEDLSTVEVSAGELYDERRSTAAPTFLPRLLVSLALAKSNSEARRLVAQGGVTIDGIVAGDPPPTLELGRPYLVRVGKRHFRRFQLAE